VPLSDGTSFREEPAGSRPLHSAATSAFDDGRLSSWNLIVGVLVPWP
jgi:hypothetical protein